MTLTILADDLTGACDTGALFARRAAVAVTVWPAPPRDGVVRVIDTESRALDAETAACRVRRAATMAPADRYFKKIDSTLRGSVGAEVDALMRATGVGNALVCPAFPAQGRRVRNRTLLVNGAPVAETPVARDPHFPRSGDGGGAASDVVELVRAGLGPRSVSWLPLADVRAGRDKVAASLDRLGESIVVADAETDADLETLVDAALLAPVAPVLAGAAGLASALARHLGLLADPVTIPPARRWLVVVGSRHPASRRQIEFARNAGLEVIATPDADLPDRAEAARQVAAEARRRLTIELFEMIAVTGGETALALCQALGADGIDLVGAPSPGLALGHLRAPSFGDPWILTKAGGFGDAELFSALAGSTGAQPIRGA